ncbi:hypothetical protein [Streptomyces sp. NPDC051567]|uniref:hypothetical protein n=1 Tax=Streptomyces sp. NPDC051567 TaxID=3365660 RepID=UPI0037AC0BA5
MNLSGAHGSQEPDDGERPTVAVEMRGPLADRTRLALLRRPGEGEADVTTPPDRPPAAARPSPLPGLLVREGDIPSSSHPHT